jgi:hypothetical protein
MNPNDHVAFRKSVRVGFADDLDASNSETHFGSIRYNPTTDRLEGLHKLAGADIFGNTWREMGVDVASETKIGGVRIGENLFINPATGVMSAVGSSPSRMNQRIITISPSAGISDFSDISTAILATIGTSANGWNDGSLTRKYGVPAISNRFILELTIGLHTSSETIELPDFVSLVGYGSDECMLVVPELQLGEYSNLKNLTVNGKISACFKDSTIIDNVNIIGDSTTNSPSILIEAGSGHKLTNIDINIGDKGACGMVGISAIKCSATFRNINIVANSPKAIGIELVSCEPVILEEIIKMDNLTYRGIWKSPAIHASNSMFSCSNSNLGNGYIVLDGSEPINASLMYQSGTESSLYKLIGYNAKNNLVRMGFLENGFIRDINSCSVKTAKITKLNLDSLVVEGNLTKLENIPIEVKRLMLVDLDNVVASLVVANNTNYLIQSHGDNITPFQGSSILRTPNNIYKVGEKQHFRSLADCLQSAEFPYIHTIQITSDISESTEIRCKAGISIIGSGAITGVKIKLGDGVRFHMNSNMKLKNIELEFSKSVEFSGFENIAISECSFISRIGCNGLNFANCRNITMVNSNVLLESGGIDGIRAISFNSTEIRMCSVVIKVRDNSGNSQTAGIYMDGGISGGSGNSVKLRNVDIELDFGDKLMLEGGYSIDSCGDSNGSENSITAIGCIFNRNFYISPSIRQMLVSCVY